MEKAGQNDLLFLSKKYRKMDILQILPIFALNTTGKSGPVRGKMTFVLFAAGCTGI